MKESQTIEFKESWRDEYLKWICGFANAEGGVLIIGRNDRGSVVGVSDSARLMEELPNKVRDVLGILVAVNLLTESGKDMIEIRVEDYPSPISYKGAYYLRSGSTNQLLKGTALDRFLIRKQGRTWDGVPVPHVGIKDLSPGAIATFRALAKQGRRLDASLLEEPDAVLVEKLHLLEGAYLKRAALLLFHPDPERFIAGAYVKIGYFQTESELVYHDEIHGDLFTQTQKTLDILFAKYLKAVISYRGIHRLETLPVPEEALREAILNALIHRDYAIGSPIQIRVYANKLRIWNPGELPDNWTADQLLQPHSSRPYNPAIANAFFRAGEIEAWGRGIQRIVDACREAGSPDPVFDYAASDLWLEFPYSTDYLKILAESAEEKSADGKGEASGNRRGSVGGASEKTSEKTSEKILQAVRDNNQVTIAELAEISGVTTRSVERNIQKLQKTGRLNRVGPDKGGHWEVLK